MKIWKRILSLVVSVGCLASMTACDINAFLDELKGGKNGLSGPVTQEEWNALMDGVVNAENVTMRLTFQYMNIDKLKTDIRTYKRTSNAYESYDGGDNHEFLDHVVWEKVGSEYHYFGLSSQAYFESKARIFLHQTITQEEIDAFWLPQGLFYNLGNYKEIYPLLTYDEEKSAYVGENILTHDIHGKEDVLIDFMEITIEGKNLTFDMEYLDCTGKIEVYDYGKTVIKTPEDYREAPKQEEEIIEIGTQEWDEAFISTYASPNYTMAILVENFALDGSFTSPSSESIYKYSPTELSVQENGLTPVYYRLEDEMVVQYQKEGAAWVRKVCEEETPLREDLMKCILYPYQEKYAQFTFKEAEGIFSIKNKSASVSSHEPYYRIRVTIVDRKVAKIECVSRVYDGLGTVFGWEKVTIFISDLEATNVEFPSEIA